MHATVTRLASYDRPTDPEDASPIMAAKKSRKTSAAGGKPSAAVSTTVPVELRAEEPSPLAADAVVVVANVVSGTAPPSFQPPGSSPEMTLEQKAKYLAEVEERLLNWEKNVEAREAAASEHERRVTKKAEGLDIDLCRAVCLQAGRSLGIDCPTPAFVGGAMYDLGFCNETPPGKPLLKPKAVFDLIHSERKNQISPQILAEMDKYRKPGAAKPPAGVKPPKKPKSQTSGHAADELSEHFGERMHVLKNCQLADTRKVGRNYDRFLTGWGPTIFNNWPQWADPTGGHEILDVLNREPPPPGP